MYDLFNDDALHALMIGFNGLFVCEWLKRKLNKFVCKYLDLHPFAKRMAMIALIAFLIMASNTPPTDVGGSMFWHLNPVTDSSTIGTFIILIGFFMLLTIGHQLKAFYLFRYEVVIILLILILTNALAVRYNDLLELFILLEISSLVTFTLATFYPRARENWESRLNMLRASEASLKYFIISSFASVLFLTGLVICVVLFKLTRIDECFLNSLIILPFNTDQSVLEHTNFIFLVVAILLILIALLIKLGVAPFDRTTIDTYDGVAIPILSIFAIMGKLFHFGILMIYCYSINNLFEILQIYTMLYPPTLNKSGELSLLINYLSYKQFFNSILFVSALTSLVVGSIGILVQVSVQRFIAYSAISNLGFMLIGVAAGTSQGTASAIVYLITYLFATLNIFIIFALATLKENKLDTLSNCLKLYRTQSLLGWLLIINFFSFGGVPPLAGFYAKFYILDTIAGSHLYLFWYLVAFISTATVFYYLYLITSIYFQSPDKKPVGAIRKNWEYVIHFDFTLLITLFVLCILTGFIIWFPFSSDSFWFLTYEVT